MGEARALPHRIEVRVQEALRKQLFDATLGTHQSERAMFSSHGLQLGVSAR
jgi:hypothetical protein